MTVVRIPLDIVVTATGQTTKGVLVGVMAVDLDRLERKALLALGLANTLQNLAAALRIMDGANTGRALGQADAHLMTARSILGLTEEQIREAVRAGGEGQHGD